MIGSYSKLSQFPGFDVAKFLMPIIREFDRSVKPSQLREKNENEIYKQFFFLILRINAVAVFVLFCFGQA